jgi:hypothetical protein
MIFIETFFLNSNKNGNERILNILVFFWSLGKVLLNVRMATSIGLMVIEKATKFK